MATPTPSTNTPGQKHLLALSSPAPRSVPPRNFDSPHVLSMLNEGGIGMGISMSGMGMSGMGMSGLSQLGLSQLGRGDEDERRRRLESIIQLLKTRPGRVSEEGIIALCKKEGVEFERAVEGDGSVVLTLVIGNEAMCDIAIKKGDVESVKLELASDDDGTFKDSGSDILFKSLTTTSRPGQNKINLMLDQFAGNLDKLLRMDKLSADNGGVQCFKAVFALHGSLKRLFEHEKKMALAVLGDDAVHADLKAEREVLCKKSGRPRMNAGTCLGLSLEYWMDRRYLLPRKKSSSQLRSSKGKEKQTPDEKFPEDSHPLTNKIYSLTLECEASPSSMYTPIRIPPSWISTNIETEKPPDGPNEVINSIINNTSTVDWLDPKPTYLDSPTATGDHDAMNIDNAPGRLPNIRFVARFNPPLVVPLSVYVNIMNSVGLECPQDLQSTTFVGLAVRPDEPDPGMNTMAGGYTIEIRSERSVFSVDKHGKETQKRHTNSLYVPKLEFSRTLESLPFQHPRQLVELLPTLRQYAFTTSLIQNTFVDIPKDAAAGQDTKTESTPISAPLTTPRNAHNGNGDENENEEALQVDVSLAYSPPAPRLIVTLPHLLTTTTPPNTTTIPSSPDTNTLTPSSALPTRPKDLLAHLLSAHPLKITEPHTQSEQEPQLQTQPSSPTQNTPIKLTLDILPNATVFIHDQNLTSGAGDKSGAPGADADVDMQQQQQEEVGEREGKTKESDKIKRLAKALDICGDLGVWGEWVGREVEGAVNA